MTSRLCLLFISSIVSQSLSVERQHRNAARISRHPLCGSDYKMTAEKENGYAGVSMIILLLLAAIDSLGSDVSSDSTSGTGSDAVLSSHRSGDALRLLWQHISRKRIAAGGSDEERLGVAAAARIDGMPGRESDDSGADNLYSRHERAVCVLGILAVACYLNHGERRHQR